MEHGLFARAGLDVRLARNAPAQERESRDPIARRKEALFESERADLFNLCEWGGIDRLERNRRGGYIGYLRPAVVAQALLSFDPELNEPHDVSGVPVGVNEFTGSHYTALHLLEGTVPRDRIRLEHVGPPSARLAAAAAGDVRAVMLMEPYLSLALESGRTCWAATSTGARRSWRRTCPSSGWMSTCPRSTRPSTSSTPTAPPGPVTS
ncbi:hypothetical protein NKH77_01135 [Streptomyces sp. M19]